MSAAAPGMVRIYVGLGANLEDPAAQVSTALDELAQLPDTRLAARSGLYRSRPLGPADQPDYINAVAGLDTGLSPTALLEQLQAIEARHGRRRDGTRWGPRTLDLDILVHGDTVLDTEVLTLPHPGVHQRNFVLLPLLEIAPDLVVPGRGTVRELAARCPAEGIERLEDGA